MKTYSQTFENAIKASPRSISCAGYLLNPPGEVWSNPERPYTYSSNGILQSCKVTTSAEKGKFFGYSVSQQATFKFINTYDDPIEESKAWWVPDIYSGAEVVVGFQPKAGAETAESVSFPSFIITSATRDETAGEVNITAYDWLSLTDRSLEEVIPAWRDLPTIRVMAQRIVENTIASTAHGFLSHSTNEQALFSDTVAASDLLDDYDFLHNADFTGKETVREVINQICEVLGAIAYIDSNNNLVFWSLAESSVAPYSIDRSDYFDFSVEKPFDILGIASVTDLGDNVIVEPYPGAFNDGYHQCLYNNAFLTNMTSEDRWSLLYGIWERMIHAIVPNNVTWRGNPCLEPGDFLQIEMRDGETELIPVLNYSLEYDGGLDMSITWSGAEADAVDSQPRTISEAIKQTYARVDRQNSIIALKADKVDIEGLVSFSNLTDGTTTISGDNITTGTISAVNIDIGSGAFAVDSDGNMTCNDAVISGNATFTGSSVGAVNVDTSTLTADTIIAGDETVNNLKVNNELTVGSNVTLKELNSASQTLTAEITVVFTKIAATKQYRVVLETDTPLQHAQSFEVKYSALIDDNLYVGMVPGGLQLLPGATQTSNTVSFTSSTSALISLTSIKAIALQNGEAFTQTVGPYPDRRMIGGTLTQKYSTPANILAVNGDIVPGSIQYAVGTQNYPWSNVQTWAINGANFPTAAGDYVLRVDSRGNYSFVKV